MSNHSYRFNQSFSGGIRQLLSDCFSLPYKFQMYSSNDFHLSANENEYLKKQFLILVGTK